MLFRSKSKVIRPKRHHTLARWPRKPYFQASRSQRLAFLTRKQGHQARVTTLVGLITSQTSISGQPLPAIGLLHVKARSAGQSDSARWPDNPANLTSRPAALSGWPVLHKSKVIRPKRQRSLARQPRKPYYQASRSQRLACPTQNQGLQDESNTSSRPALS